MATVNPTLTSRLQIGGDDSCVLFTWALTSTNTDGLPIEWTQWSDRCLQFVGTWGGATLTMQGSNDGTNWFTLSKAANGNDFTATADGGEQVIETPRFFRPNLTTAGVGASISVLLLARRNQPLRV